MSIFKRSLAALGAVAIIAGALSGCGGNSGGKDMKTATIWLSYGHSKDYWEEKVNDFNKTIGKDLGVNLALECKTDSSYNQAIDVAMQSNQLPTFFDNGSCQKVDELGVGYPINELPGMEETIAKYEHLMQHNVHRVGEKIYALPFCMTTRGLIYNKDMFKAAGLVDENGEAKPPKTYDEVREYAKKLTDKSKDQYGMIFPLKWGAWVESDILTVSNANSGYLKGYDPKTGTYDMTVLEPVINMIMGIKEDGSAYPGAEGLDNDPARAKFSTGNIGMKFGYSFDVGVLNDQFPMEADWGVAPLPVESTDKCYNQPAVVGSSAILSKAGVEEIGVEAAAAIYKFLYSDESVAELYKRGKDLPCLWEIVEDIEQTDDMPNGWAEFAKMTEISVVDRNPMPMKLEGSEKITDIVINRIWTNGEEVAPLLKDYTERVNKGVQTYKELHPEKDYSIYIADNWEDLVRRESY